MTPQEIVEYIKANGKNGALEIDVIGTEQVDERTELGSDPILVDHEFQYTQIILVKKDVTNVVKDAITKIQEYGKEAEAVTELSK